MRRRKAADRTKLVYDGNEYKSKFELDIARGLTRAGIHFYYEVSSWHYPYSVTGKVQCEDCGSKRIVKMRKYTPDFFLYSEDSRDLIVLETKGYLQPTDRTIIKHAASYADAEGIDYRILFMRNNSLKLKKTPTYLSWAESIGVKAYVGPTFPSEILEDLGYES